MRKSFYCVDGHTCGNPVRLVAGGGPVLQGENMGAKRLDFLQHHDWIRQGLMYEPRGHDMMSGSILYPVHDPANDMAVLFIETSGCLPMCGHGLIGTVTIALEEGLIIPKEEGHLRVETPAGLIQVTYTRNKRNPQKIASVKLINIPSFLYLADLKVECPDLGTLTVDVAYGGNFYAIVDPQAHYPGLEHFTAADLIRWSPMLRQRLNEAYRFIHPLDSRIAGLSHLLWTGATLAEEADARNAVFYGEKAIDRSPCGTGTSARMAQWAARGKLQAGDRFIHESIIGSQFVGTVESTTTCGEYAAIIPGIEGWAKITGYNHIIIDEQDDPYAHGFQVK